MDTKQISIGAIAVAALVVAVGKGEKTTKIAASVAPADVAITAVANLSPEVSAKTCTREWVEVRPNPPALRWVCDGAYSPQAQAELNKLAGDDGVSVVLTPRDDGKGGVRFDAQVTRGEMPVHPNAEK